MPIRAIAYVSDAAPGMTPEEVESRITVPIEQELLGIPGQKMLRSVAKYALTDQQWVLC